MVNKLGVLGNYYIHIYGSCHCKNILVTYFNLISATYQQCVRHVVKVNARGTPNSQSSTYKCTTLTMS